MKMQMQLKIQLKLQLLIQQQPTLEPSSSTQDQNGKNVNDLNYEQRLSEWSTFRDSLEASEDPLQDVINYYNKIPTVSIQTDPYTPSTWSFALGVN